MKNRGFTLMELLVVLLIIGILSTVALRTIDATRDRSLFDQTTKEMTQLVQAMTGNPDLTFDGRRVDFGFYGDMGRLPQDLRELVYNQTGSPYWRGPYVRQMMGGDTASYRYDGWGNEYGYTQATGTISSLGNGKFPMTVRVADSIVQLYNSSISGTISDVDNNPPGIKAANISLELHYSSGRPTRLGSVSPGGFYEYTLAKGDTVPIGTHQLLAILGADTLSRWVAVTPRSKTVLDFRFSRSFRNQLKMVGAPALAGDSGFQIQVVNDGETPDTVRYIYFATAPAESCYMNILAVNYVQAPNYPRIPANHAIGLGDTAFTYSDVVVPPEMSEAVSFGFFNFVADSMIDTLKSSIIGKTFLFRFSDGSEITVTPTP
jgi:prepilin-type N-terminal cleavage/methylation domain-containing protein